MIDPGIGVLVASVPVGVVLGVNVGVAVEVWVAVLVGVDAGAVYGAPNGVKFDVQRAILEILNSSRFPISGAADEPI